MFSLLAPSDPSRCSEHAKAKRWLAVQMYTMEKKQGLSFPVFIQMVVLTKRQTFSCKRDIEAEDLSKSFSEFISILYAHLPFSSCFLFTHSQCLFRQKPLIPDEIPLLGIPQEVPACPETILVLSQLLLLSWPSKIISPHSWHLWRLWLPSSSL